MTNSERRRMRKLWRMREREIEELNNPRRIIFIEDVIKEVAFGVVFAIGMMGAGWLCAIGIDRLMVALGLY